MVAEEKANRLLLLSKMGYNQIDNKVKPKASMLKSVTQEKYKKPVGEIEAVKQVI